MATFFEFYKTITANYIPDISSGGPPALGSHLDLFAIIRLMRRHPNLKRSELTKVHFSTQLAGNTQPVPDVADQNRAFNLAFRIMTTITCSLEASSTEALEAGLQPIAWADEMSWTAFLSNVFPSTISEVSSRGTERNSEYHRIKDKVTARKLMKVARLKLLPTNELSHHLRLNQEQGTIEIYRHTAFLKESLMASKKDSE